MKLALLLLMFLPVLAQAALPFATARVEYRPVTLGPVVDGLRVIREGVRPDEMIVVNGLQHVRPGGEVAPQLIAMGESHGAADGIVAQNVKTVF